MTYLKTLDLKYSMAGMTSVEFGVLSEIHLI